MSSVLITGANGFIGSSLLQEMILKGWQVRGAVRTICQLPEGLDLVRVGDINGDTDWTESLNRVDVVVHLAARVHVMRESISDPLSQFRIVNVAGTLNLARQAAEAKVKRFVFISSIKVNGEDTSSAQYYHSGLNVKFTEEDLPAPKDPYAISKMEAEAGLREITAKTGMELVIVRPPLVYGNGVKANFAKLTCAVKSGWPLPLGSVFNLRSLVGIDNLVDFIILCVSHPQAANHIFLVSDGHDLSTTDLVRMMAQIAKVQNILVPVPVWVLRVVALLMGKNKVVQRLCGNLQIDISKSFNLLGWIPPVSVEEGLRRAMDL